MNTCGKMKFATRRTAERRLKGANRASRNSQGNTRDVTDGHAYWCGQCNAWHWSRLTKREAQRRGWL